MLHILSTAIFFTDNLLLPLQGAVMIPNCFGSDFGDEIDSYAVLDDKNGNEFEMRVERIRGSIFLTRGWAALRDFYDIGLGAWFSLVFTGLGRFLIRKIKTRVKRIVTIPVFVPPMRFSIDKCVLPSNVSQPFPACILDLQFRHAPANFQLKYETNLTADDVNSGFLVRNLLTI